MRDLENPYSTVSWKTPLRNNKGYILIDFVYCMV